LNEALPRQAPKKWVSSVKASDSLKNIIFLDFFLINLYFELFFFIFPHEIIHGYFHKIKNQSKD
jgi:hypothetical protein